MLTIEELGQEGIPIIQTIAHATWQHNYSPIMEQDYIDYIMGMMYTDEKLKADIAQGVQFLLAIKDDQPLGFAAYEHLDGVTTKVHKLYILPQAQGSGVGRAFISCISDRAAIHGSKKLQLNVYRKNPAIEFYKKVGFKLAYEQDVDVGNGYFMYDFVLEKEV